MSNAIEFADDKRIHISLDVRNLDDSLRFYESLFGAGPSKHRRGYAKFEPREPAVNLALNQVAEPVATESRVSHFGIQVKNRQAVRDAAARLAKAGLSPLEEDQVTCCYAVQDKVWVEDPDGNAWEVFVVTEADTEAHHDGKPGPSLACCPTNTGTSCC